MPRKRIDSDIINDIVRPKSEAELLLDSRLKQADCPWWLRLSKAKPDTKDEGDIPF